MDIVIPADKPIDGNLYQIVLDPGQRNWESGYVEDWYWMLIPYASSSPGIPLT